MLLLFLFLSSFVNNIKGNLIPLTAAFKKGEREREGKKRQQKNYFGKKKPKKKWTTVVREFWNAHMCSIQFSSV